MRKKQTATRAWLLSTIFFATLSLTACGGGLKDLPPLKASAPEPNGTTEQDRERGWKLVKAYAEVAYRDEFEQEESLLSAVFKMFSYANKAPVYADIYFYKSVDKLACQLYYNGVKKKKVGTKIGSTKGLPDKRSRKTGLVRGLLSFGMKGPGKKHAPRMILACDEDKKALPKKLLSGIPEGLHTIEVAATEK